MEKTSETKTSRRMTGLLSDCRAHGHNDLTAKGEMTLTNKASRRFKFDKRRQQLIRTHNEPLPVAVMRVRNPDEQLHDKQASAAPCRRLVIASNCA
jgi:hypothetical protein